MARSKPFDYLVKEISGVRLLRNIYNGTEILANLIEDTPERRAISEFNVQMPVIDSVGLGRKSIGGVLIVGKNHGELGRDQDSAILLPKKARATQSQLYNKTTAVGAVSIVEAVG